MKTINLNTKLEDLYPRLSSKTLKVLDRKDLLYLKEVCRMEEFQIERLQQKTTCCLEELKALMAEYNLHFGMTEVEIHENQKNYEFHPAVLSPELQEKFDAKWEQRRYELVKDMLVRLNIFEINKSCIAETLEAADMIIKALKGEI